MELDLDINEIKRYLNYNGNELDSTTSQNINNAIQLVNEQAIPKYTYNVYDIETENDKVKLLNTTIVLNSKSLSNHLVRCNRVIILVATLGLELDYLIKRLQITDLGLAYVLNAVAVEYLEKYLDYIQEEKLNINQNLTSRFSVGYGDLDLSYQNNLVNLVDATKQIGVNVLDSNLMVPSKSVSALIGLSDYSVSDDLRKCPNCLDNGKCSNKCLREDE